MARKKGPRFYQTGQSPAKSIAEIQHLLSDFGVASYHVQQEDGQPVALAWVVEMAGGMVPFRFRPNVEGLRERFDRTGVRGPRESVEAVAWRQAQELIELKLEIVESGAATLAQEFAGYVLTDGGRTVADVIQTGEGRLADGETPLLHPAR